MSKKIKKTGKIAIVLGAILALVIAYNVIPLTKAAEIGNRKITLTDSRPSRTGVDYILQGDYTASNTKCIEVDFCTTATGSCTSPTGLTTASGNKGDSGDWSGWTYANWSFSSVDANTARLTYNTGQNGGSSYKCVFGNITNPSSGGTYFARIHTYANSDCTSEIDSGNIAFAIVSGVSVSATVAETLSFSIDDNAIGFGELTNSALRYASADEVGSASETTAATLTLSTNASDGAVVTIQDIGSGSAAGLYNASTATLIEAVASSAVTAGDDEYGVFARSASGLTIDEAFDNDSTSDEAISRTANEYVSVSGPVSSGTAGIAAVASILATQPAGGYSDTLILIATPTY